MSLHYPDCSDKHLCWFYFNNEAWLNNSIRRCIPRRFKKYLVNIALRAMNVSSFDIKICFTNFSKFQQQNSIILYILLTSAHHWLAFYKIFTEIYLITNHIKEIIKCYLSIEQYVDYVNGPLIKHRAHRVYMTFQIRSYRTQRKAK